jgi:hypothetical protein
MYVKPFLILLAGIGVLATIALGQSQAVPAPTLPREA